MPTISYFIGAYAFLSNFSPSRIRYQGRTWPTVEHAYQAAKTPNKVSKEYIWKAPTPAQAKAIGRGVTLVEDWDSKRLSVMKALLDLKFERGSKLADKLLATYPNLLIEGNHWGDTFWGQVRRGDQWIGENHLGMLLMQRRLALRSNNGQLFEETSDGDERDTRSHD